MNKVKEALAAAITGISIVVSVPASAITAGELLKEDAQHISRYLSGLIDMFAYMQYVEENESRGRCISHWYYQIDETVERIYGYLEKYPDKAPEGIVMVLARKACPLEEK